MAQGNLRIYFGSDEDDERDATALLPFPRRRRTVSVTVGEIFPLLGEALAENKTWLRDFEDDEIAISSDLYEVILAYQNFRRPSA